MVGAGLEDQQLSSSPSLAHVTEIYLGEGGTGCYHKAMAGGQDRDSLGELTLFGAQHKKATPRALSETIEFLVPNNQGRQISHNIVGTNKTADQPEMKQEDPWKTWPKKPC